MVKARSKKKKGNFGKMFNKEYRTSTLIFLVCWFTSTFVYYGYTIMIPYTISSDNDGDNNQVS